VFVLCVCVLCVGTLACVWPREVCGRGHFDWCATVSTLAGVWP
jgi:hypothetical protein